MFKELGGAEIIDADEIAHQVQAPGGAAYEDIVKAFGSGILAPDASIDREKLASRVFGDEQERARLNSIVHPKVRLEEIRLLHEHRSEPLVVMMVPLLLENRMQGLVDRVVVVTVDEENREKRLFERSGMTRGEVQQRLAAQMPEAEKVRMADIVIDNSGSMGNTRDQVKMILGQLGVQSSLCCKPMA